MSTTEFQTGRKNRRIEFRADPKTDDLIAEAAELLQTTKSVFVIDAARREAEGVVARADRTLMNAEVLDSLMSSLDVADDSPELERLAKLPSLLEQ